MSKLLNIYLNEKANNQDTILLFKCGIFYIAIDKDATILSQLVHLKLTNLNDKIKKCGFPCSSLDKYLKLFSLHNLNVKLIEIDKNISYSIPEYTNSKLVQELLEQIDNVNVDNLSISDAYKFIEDLKEKVINIKL